MNFNDYIKEAVDLSELNHKLLKRYENNVAKRKKQAAKIMYKASDEWDKIADIMKKKGMTQLVNNAGSTVINTDKEDEMNWELG